MDGSSLQNGDIVTYSYSGGSSGVGTSSANFVAFTNGEQFIVKGVNSGGQSNIQLFTDVSGQAGTQITNLMVSPNVLVQSATMTLADSSFGPLVPSNAAGQLGNTAPLVDGSSYTVQAVSGKSGYYQLMEPSAADGSLIPVTFDTDPTVWNSNAVQMFTGGMLAVLPRAHRAVISRRRACTSSCRPRPTRPTR